MKIRVPVNAATALVTALFATGLFAQTRELASGGELLDGVAAIVDEGIVLKSELNERIGVVIQNIREQNTRAAPEQRMQVPPLPVLEQQVLDQLILQEIQLQRAERLGITVGDDILNQAVSRVARNLGLTLEQLPAALAAEGIDYAMYREDSRKELILSQLEQRDVLARISISPRELNDCLDRLQSSQSDEFDYNISHILIGVSSAATPEDIEAARQRIDAIVGRLEAGEEFADLALTYSESQTALEGGSLGWRKGSELPTLFADVVPNMQPGEVSQPIRSGSGFNLVRLNETRGAERVMVDQLRIRHILISPNEVLDDSAAEQRMRQIRDGILGGDDFATVAVNVSEDTVSSADGGDLGWVQANDFVPEFAEVVSALELNQLSEPFKTRFGWHLAEVTGRRSHDTTDEIKEQQCAQEIRASKAEEERELWLRRLRDQAFIDIRL